MERTIDCMGMACPLPVINAKKAIEGFTGDGTLRIRVDNETAVQNLTRLGEHNGFKVSTTRDGEKALRVPARRRPFRPRAAGGLADKGVCRGVRWRLRAKT